MTEIDRNKLYPAKSYDLKSFYIKLFSIIIISSLGIIVYSNSFNCSFQFDDDIYIINNYVIKNIQNLLINWKFYPCRFITFLSIAVNYHFNHLNVFGYHLFNLAVHLGSTFFIWWLTLLTLSTPAMKENKITQHAHLIALLAGLVFVSHPVQTEAVTYIWQRATSMVALFYLASLCLYIKSRLLSLVIPAKAGIYNRISSDYGSPIKTFGDDKKQKIYYISSLILAIVAMFTKENAVTLPLMILLYEFSFFDVKKSLNWRRLIPFLLTLFIIPLTILLAKAPQFQEIQKFVAGPRGTSPLNYLLTEFRVIVTYIRLIFLPLHQNLDYDYHISKSIFELPTLISFLFLAGILFGAKQLFSKYRLLSFSIFWFFLTLSLESSLFPLKNVIFEHRLYLPLAGYSMFLVSGVYYGTELIFRHSERSEESKGILRSFSSLRMTIVVLLMIITFNSILTYQRNKVWKNEFTLWDDAARKSPHKARPYNGLGIAYTNQGNLTEALSSFNKVIKINPNYARAYNGRGNIYNLRGELAQAISNYNMAVEIDSTLAEAPYNLAIIYDKQGNFTQALLNYNKAIEINPNFEQPYYNRGNTYATHGDFRKAITNYTKAIKIDSAYAEAYNNRGNVYSRQGNLPQALSDYNKAIEINPNYSEAYINRGNTYGRQGNFPQALFDFNKAIEINPNYAEAYSNRAVVYYQLKEYGKAWEDMHKVKALGGTVHPNFINALKKVV